MHKDAIDGGFVHSRTNAEMQRVNVDVEGGMQEVAMGKRCRGRRGHPSIEVIILQVGRTLMPIDLEDNAMLKLHEGARNTFHYEDVSGLSGSECHGLRE